MEIKYTNIQYRNVKNIDEERADYLKEQFDNKNSVNNNETSF